MPRLRPRLRLRLRHRLRLRRRRGVQWARSCRAAMAPEVRELVMSVTWLGVGLAMVRGRVSYG